MSMVNLFLGQLASIQRASLRRIRRERLLGREPELMRSLQMNSRIRILDWLLGSGMLGGLQEKS